MHAFQRCAHFCAHLLLSLPPLQCRLIKGRLVNLSMDVYIAMHSTPPAASSECSLHPPQCRLIKGRLVNLSVDVYIAMELGDGGDLFHLRGQMSGGHCCMAAWLRLLGWPTCNARSAPQPCVP